MTRIMPPLTCYTDKLALYLLLPLNSQQEQKTSLVLNINISRSWTVIHAGPLSRICLGFGVSAWDILLVGPRADTSQ